MTQLRSNGEGRELRVRPPLEPEGESRPITVPNTAVIAPGAVSIRESSAVFPAHEHTALPCVAFEAPRVDPDRVQPEPSAGARQPWGDDPQESR